MDERCTGLVLRTRPFSETSVIVHWLTADLGRVATLAKGARRPKSPFLGKLDLFFLADFTFQRSRRSDLHHLREVSVREFHPALRRDLGALQQAAYCARLLEHTTETETPLLQPFLLFLGVLTTLTEHPPRPLTVLAFEIKLLQELGLTPPLRESRLTAGSHEILEKITAADWTTLARIKPSAAQTGEMAGFLGGFLIAQIERVPAGRAEALSSTLSGH